MNRSGHMRTHGKRRDSSTAPPSMADGTKRPASSVSRRSRALPAIHLFVVIGGCAFLVCRAHRSLVPALSSEALWPDIAVTLAVVSAALLLFRAWLQGEREYSFLMEIFQSLPHPLRIFDSEGFTIRMTNLAAEEEQRSKAPACYTAVYGLSRPCNEADRPCPVETARKTREAVGVLHPVETTDGQTKWRQVSAYPILSPGGRVYAVLEHVVDVTEKKRFQQESAARARALEGRVREVDCLYGLLNMTQGVENEPHVVCGKAVRILPPAWQYPDVAEARICLYGREYQTPGYRESPWGMRCDVEVAGKGAGWVEVVYREPRPDADEGPFLKQERNLLEAVAHLISEYAERRAVHEALAESERRHRQLVDNANEAVFVLQEDRIVFHNRMTAVLIGRSEEELRSRPFLEFVAPEDRAVIAERHLRRLQGQGFESRYPCRLLQGSGSVVWIEGNSVIIEWCGRPATLCFARDVTDEKRMQEHLLESEEKFRCIGAQAQDAVIMIDNDGGVSFWNDAAERTFGYAREEVLGSNLHRLLAPEKYHRAYFEAYPRFRETGEGRAVGKTLELAARKKDGVEIPVEVSLSAVKLGGRWNAIGILRDISERKRTERDLREAKEKAEATTVAKSQFLANMSHEIRTPLNGIIGMTGLALQTDLNEEPRRYLEAVKTSADQLLRLLNDILDLSKVEAERLELEAIEFDLRSSLEFTLDQVAAAAHQKGLELLADIPPDLPGAVIGDPGRLRQIVINLLNNAVKFTESGEVGFRCEVQAEAADSVVLHCMVWDTGIGIPGDKQGSIFELFRQADGSMTRRFGGTGLGLAIVQGLCTNMGGRAWVESEPGRGSRFHFKVRVGIRKTADEPQTESGSNRLQGKRILLVDDNEENRKILSGMAASWEIACDAVGAGEAAFQRVRTSSVERRAYDLLLIDTQMPEMDGYELCRRIWELPESKETPVALLTLATENTEQAERKDPRVAARLSKPVKRAELLRVLADEFRWTGGDAAHRSPGDALVHTPVQSAGNRLRILLAEDNSINQQVAVAMLERFGHTVTVAGDGRRAVEAAKEGAFDLILMDGQMPLLDGLEATRIIRGHERSSGARVPVVALTAHAMKGDRERFLAAGMDDYLTKPLDPQRLREVLEKWGDKDGETRFQGASPQQSGEEGGEPPGVLPVNLERALARACGDKVFLEQMLSHFADDIQRQLERFEEIIEQGDAAQLARLAHTLKGSAATLGADRIAAVALELEKTGAGESLLKSKELLSELAKEMSRFSEFVSRPGWMEVN